MDANNELLQAIGRMMDDKLSAALEPITARLDKLEQGQADLQESQQTVRDSQLRVELEQYPRIAAAIDGVVDGIEKDKEQDRRIVLLERKTDNYDTRIHVLEASVKAL